MTKEDSRKFTFVSGAGCSVIDYCIMSKSLSICKSLKIVESVVSPHMCVEFSVHGRGGG